MHACMHAHTYTLTLRLNVLAAKGKSWTKVTASEATTPLHKLHHCWIYLYQTEVALPSATHYAGLPCKGQGKQIGNWKGTSLTWQTNLLMGRTSRHYLITLRFGRGIWGKNQQFSGNHMVDTKVLCSKCKETKLSWGRDTKFIATTTFTGVRRLSIIWLESG